MRLVLSQPSHRELGENSHIHSMMRLVERSNLALEPEDVLVLPEQVGGHASERDYVDDVAWLARSCGCHVVGGSHIRKTDQGLVNCGVVTNGSGSVLAEYEKANPYGPENAWGVAAGRGGAQFEVAGLSVLVIVCADFWYAESYQGFERQPDVVVIPALTLSRRPSPRFARARWRHAVATKSYELTAFVGVSDWAAPPPGVFGGSGVSGFADPNPSRPEGFFQSLGRKQLAAFPLDPGALEELRGSRQERGFRAAPSP